MLKAKFVRHANSNLWILKDVKKSKASDKRDIPCSAYGGISKFWPYRVNVKNNPINGSLECAASNQKYDQNDVRKCCSEVDNLWNEVGRDEKGFVKLVKSAKVAHQQRNTYREIQKCEEIIFRANTLHELLARKYATVQFLDLVK